MNKNSKLTIIIVFAIFACIFLFAILVLKNNGNNSIVVKDNVKIVSAETNQVMRINDNEIYFEDNPGYKENDIIVSGITNHAPNGFVRKVINVDDNGNAVIIHTENAVLTDVFEEAHISKVFLLSNTEATEVNEDSLRETLDFDNTQTNARVFEFTNDIIGVEQVYAESNDEYQFQKDFGYPLTENLDVEGNVGFNAWLQVDIDIEDEEILWTMAFHTETGGEMFVGCRKGEEFPFEKELFTKDLPSIEFLAGEVPVVITNRIESILEGTLGFEGEIGTTVNLDSKSSTGFQYSSIDNKVTDVSESEYLSDGIEWNTSASVQGDATVGVNLNLVSMLYDCTGASLGVGLEESNSAQLCLDPDTDIETATYFGRIDLSISPKIQGSIIVQSPVIDEELCSTGLFEKEFNPLWEKSWKSSKNWEKEYQEGVIKQAWKEVYGDIIGETVNMINDSTYNNRVYFIGIYYSSNSPNIDLPGRGGVSSGYPIDGNQVVYCLKDISNEQDGIPELLIGLKENNDYKILAIYSYSYKNKQANLIAWDRVEEEGEVYLSKDNLIYEGTFEWGEFSMLYESRKLGFSAWRKGQDEDRIVDTNVLGWNFLSKW